MKLPEPPKPPENHVVGLFTERQRKIIMTLVLTFVAVWYAVIVYGLVRQRMHDTKAPSAGTRQELPTTRHPLGK
jgi:hypothetical protein